MGYVVTFSAEFTLFPVIFAPSIEMKLNLI